MCRKLSCYNLPWPANWTGLFGAERRLIIEIGFGNGDHLIHLARQHPDANVIGIEIANKSMEKAEKKIMAQSLKNVKAIYSRAETTLYHLLTTGSVSEFHINYPDPWFKSRHERRRLIRRDTVRVMVERLQPGGLLYLATDIIEYARTIHALLSTTPGIENTLGQNWVNALPDRFITKYEARGLREGRPGNYFVYRRTNKPAQPIPTVRELNMPHIILQTPMSLNAIVENFQRKKHPLEDTHLSLLDAYLNPRLPSILFEVAIQEPTIDQHVAILLSPRRRANEYILQAGSIGHPRATIGLHRATVFLADWIASLHPDARILAKKVKT